MLFLDSFDMGSPTSIWSQVYKMARQLFNTLKEQYETRHVDDLMVDIIVLSWRWSMNRLNMKTCLHYEWNWNPQECLLR